MAELVSVIVPVYKVEKDLPRCLDSILAQTYPHIEVIAVDDGSPDGSGTILDEYAKVHKNLVVIHKENGGVTSARLRGVAEAKGQWIGFVDGDDYIEPDMYQRLLCRALEYQADISHCGYRMVFADGRVNYFHNTGQVRIQDRQTAVRGLLEGTLVEPGLCNKLFRSSLFPGLQEAMPADIRINEDLLMNFHLFSGAKSAVFEDWCPYHYIVRSTSASRAKMNEHKIYDPIRVKDIIRSAAPPELQEDAQRAYVDTCINTYNGLLETGKEYRKDREKVRSLLRAEKEAFALLGKKRGIMAKMILVLPRVYRPVYWFYCKFLQKNVYE